MQAGRFFLLFTMGVWSVASDGDWSRWRGNAQNGATTSQGAWKLNDGYGLKEVWKRELGSAYSSVSVQGNQAVTMYSDGTEDWVVSFSPETGEEQWRRKIGETYKGHNGSHDGPNSTPIIEGDRVFALGPFGDLLALKLSNGDPLWRTHLVNDLQAVIPPHGFTTVPVLFNNKLIVETGGEQKAVTAIDAATGKLLWSAIDDQVNYESPITAMLANKTQLVFAGRQNVMGLNPDTGAVYWTFEHKVGGGAINPLDMGDNKLFITGNGRESVMIQITNDMQVKELWRSSNLTRSFNIPVAHKGFIYGFTGRFLTCLNAETGELAWKSRPPGDGFLILVDDHLVILTKAGTLHIAKASPDDFHELANTQLFDSVVWTPPSVASGKIFSRSLKDVAVVEIAKVAQPIAQPEATPVAEIKGSKFQAFVASLADTDDKKTAINDYLKQFDQFPIIEGDRYAHIIYHGEAKDIALVGDMIETNTELPLTRVEGTNLFYASFELEPDARLNYRFNKDFGQSVTDPKNPHTVPSFFGDMSQLAMPQWQAPAYLQEKAGELKGKLDTFSFKSTVLNNERNISVYLPPGYNENTDKYPVLYVNYGPMSISAAQLPNTMEYLVAHNKMKPVIGVFIDAPNSGQEYARNQRDQFAQMIAEEIVPHIDQTYRTLAAAESRAFVGCDEGGYAAIYTAFKHPGTFSMLGGQSTHLMRNGNGGEEINALIDASPKLPVRFYLDWGSYEYRNEQGGYNWADLNREFFAKLKEKGYPVEGGEHHGGWGWASWRTQSDRILTYFFGK
ncbi:MAG: PQQ-binding-like beta-propeller repeat protein [Acidobacteria bacterium]|nr:PQQ-binding-like beta-propeller repeat protein [Acidobacteriota bacterium]